MKLKSLMGFEKGAVNVDVSEKNRLSEILIALIRNLQADGQDWVDLARVGAPLAAAGVNSFRMCWIFAAKPQRKSRRCSMPGPKN